MNTRIFREALEYAIAKEHAAADFYRGLAGMASFVAQVSTLANFSNMEEDHATKLASLNARGTFSLSDSAVMDLTLVKSIEAGESPTANTATANTATAKSDFLDILAAAIRKEEASCTMYVDLAAACLDPDVRAVFLRLAAEEKRHRIYFEELVKDCKSG